MTSCTIEPRSHGRIVMISSGVSSGLTFSIRSTKNVCGQSGIALQRGRRDERGAVGVVGQTFDAFEIAVEAGEVIRAAGIDELEGAVERIVIDEHVAAGEVPQSPFLLAARTIGARDAFPVRGDGAQFETGCLGPARRLELGLLGQGAKGRHEPAARQALGTPAQISAREARDDMVSGRESRKHGAMVAPQSIPGGRKRAFRGDADGLGEQRIDPVPTGVEVFGESQHEQMRDVERGCGGDRPDEHSVTEPPDAGFARVEIDLQDLDELAQPWRVADAFELDDRSEHDVDRGRGALLGLRQPGHRVGGADVSAEHRPRPLPQRCPAGERAALLKSMPQLGDEGPELLRLEDGALAVGEGSLARVGVVPIRVETSLVPRLVVGEALAPIAARDAGLARKSLPPRARNRRRAVADADRHPSQPVEERVAAQVVGVEGEQCEVPVGDRVVAQRSYARSVGRDSGCREMIVQQPRVGPRNRMERRDPVRRDAVREQGPHLAHDRAHLVVGVRRVQHAVGEAPRSLSPSVAPGR